MKRCIYSYFLIFLGALLLALGINLFLLPQKLSTGGVSGIGTVLKYMFNVPLSLTNVIFNFFLFLLGFKMLGKNLVFRTVVGIVFLTVNLEITSYLPEVHGDRLSALIAGSVLTGLGIGLIIRQKTSSGGSDFLALMLNKRFSHIGIAKIIFIIDCFGVIISGIIFRSFEVTVYSLSALYLSSKISDYILTLGENAKSVYIFSEENDKIAKEILIDLQRGVTAIKAKGMYKNSEKEILFCAVTPKELPRIVSLVKEKDENAFLIINDVHKILGEGFKKHLTI